MWTCKQCGGENPDNFAVCPGCGSARPEPERPAVGRHMKPEDRENAERNVDDSFWAGLEEALKEEEEEEEAAAAPVEEAEESPEELEERLQEEKKKAEKKANRLRSSGKAAEADKVLETFEKNAAQEREDAARKAAPETPVDEKKDSNGLLMGLTVAFSRRSDCL